MGLRRLFLLTILTVLTGCAQGYSTNPPPASQPEPTQKFYSNPYTNPETEQEYRRRIWWENYESERPRIFRRW